MTLRYLPAFIVLLLCHQAVAKKRVIQGPRNRFSEACKRSTDCAFIPSICGHCLPCSPSWRRVGTKEHAERNRATAARARCRPHKCRPCGSAKNWLGTRAVCRRGRCIAEHEVNVEPHKACKVNNDCTFHPGSNCGCPPCGPTPHRAINNKHKRWLLNEYARESCPPVKCAKCSKPVRWTGDKAVCRAGQCVVLP